MGVVLFQIVKLYLEFRNKDDGSMCNFSKGSVNCTTLCLVESM